MSAIRLKHVAVEMEMVTVSVHRRAKDAIWNFMAANIDRLRPIGFDGREVICLPKFKVEVEAVVSRCRQS